MTQTFYNKHRPKTFEDLVGQELLKNAIQYGASQNSLPHAFLLVGPRGTGKTTTARIIAKCLNCEKGVTPTPCQTCSFCTSIDDNNCMDVQETDAASNRGIDDIRDIKKKASYGAMSGIRYKVFIIDEVHRLTEIAFDALLKTLEEPPANTVFILCTTEYESVPDTIVSRCMTFSLRKFTVDEIVMNLMKICSIEQIPVQEEALWVIAKAAKGGMRDALSDLGKAQLAGAGTITTDIAIQATHTVGHDIVLKLINSIMSAQMATALQLTCSLDKGSIDPNSILQELIDCFYSLYACLLTGQQDLMSYHPKSAIGANLLGYIQYCDLNRLAKLIEVLSTSHKELILNPNPKYYLDIVIHKAIIAYHT